MSNDEFFGMINTLFIIVSVYGVYSQLRKIQERRAQLTGEHTATELLSLNQFSVSFLAYFSFFIYGYSIEPFNHFIVWPRLLASCFVAAILSEIWRDKRNYTTSTVLALVAASFAAGLLGLAFSEGVKDESRLIATSLIVVITLLIAQGYFHQIKLIWQSGRTGAVDLKMSQFILMMDISTIAFALSIGLADGWPLLMLAITSGITKLVIMYLFFWVRVSRLAAKRRHLMITG